MGGKIVTEKKACLDLTWDKDITTYKDPLEEGAW